MVRKISELFVAVDQDVQLFLSKSRGEQHPEILNNRTCSAIIKIDQSHAVAKADQIAPVTIAVNADGFATGKQGLNLINDPGGDLRIRPH